jgi:hypothetical protein
MIYSPAHSINNSFRQTLYVLQLTQCMKTSINMIYHYFNPYSKKSKYFFFSKQKKVESTLHLPETSTVTANRLILNAFGNKLIEPLKEKEAKTRYRQNVF